MNRRKILFVITKSNWGGAQKYVFELASRLPKNSFDVAVALGGTGKPGAPAGILAEKLTEAGIRTIFIPSLQRDISPFKEFQVLFELIRLFKAEHPDIVHLNSSKIGGTGSLAAWIARIPKIVFTIHGWAYYEDRNAPSKALIWLASVATSFFSTDLIAISKNIEEQWQTLPATRGKIHCIYNGIAPETPRFGRNEARTALGLPENAIMIGTIAELTKNKGLVYALQAFANIRNPATHFAIIGDGEERTALETKARSLGIHDRVHFVGFKENASAYLPAFDIFSLSSIKEGLPFVILEAGLAKVPVVTTHVGSTSEIIEHEKTGLLVPPKDPIALETAYRRLIESTGSREILGKNLYETVLTRFSLDSTILKTIAVFDPEIVPEKKRAVSAIIRNQLGNFLLIRNHDRSEDFYDEWSLIGSRVDEHETSEEAVIKIVREKTGLTLGRIRHLANHATDSQETNIFYGEVDTGKEEMVPEEKQELLFRSPRDTRDFIRSIPVPNRALEELLNFLKTECGI